MSKDTAQDLIHTNAEYEKLKKGSPDRDHAPRETPQMQGPGRAGYDKQFYAEWTREELIEQARRLELVVSDDVSRESLIEQLERRDATAARSVGD